jgi:hypothetical protein
LNIRTVLNAAGFGDETEWHIYKHDMYGAAFRNAWLSRELLEPEDRDVD